MNDQIRELSESGEENEKRLRDGKGENEAGNEHDGKGRDIKHLRIN